LLTLSQATVPFGNVTNGADSAPVTITVTNTGTIASGSFTPMLGGTNPNAFAVRNSSCTGALGPTGTCRFDVVFAPRATGPFAAAVGIMATPGGGGLISLTGTGTTPAALTVAPTSFDFMGVAVGSGSMPRSFTITNSGGSPSGQPSASFSGADGAMFSSTSTCSAAGLAPGGVCTVTVVFTPTASGARLGTLDVTANPGGDATPVTLRGTGLRPAAITTSALVLFPDTVTLQTSAAVMVTVTNTGEVPTPTLGLALSGTAMGDFQRVMAGDTCTGALLVPGSCTVSYTFRPTATGLRTANLTVTAGSLTPATARFEGVGLAPASLAFAGSSLDLGIATTGTNTATSVIGLTNSGDVASGPVSFSFNPLGEFSIASTSCGTSTVVVVPRSTCTVTIRFAPSAVGGRSSVLTATATPGGSAGPVMLTGQGVSPGNLSITPTSRDFGRAVVGATGSPTFEDFVVTNTGGTTLTAVNLAVIGGATSSFVLSMNTCGGNLNPSGTCGGRVTFLPQSVGSLTSFLRATSGTNTAQAGLSGVGQNQAVLQPQDPSVNFPATVVMQSATSLDFTLRNDGDVSSGAVTFTSSNPAFTIIPGTCMGTIAASATCTGSIRFTPTAAGAQTSTITVVASPGGGLTFTANGTGITPAALTLAPASGSGVAYGNVLLGATATNFFTVTNTGQQASGPLSLAMSGPNAAQWQISTGVSSCQLGQPLPGGASCTSSVRFTAFSADGPGPKQGTLTASATPGTSPSLTLTATVQSPAQLAVTDTVRAFGGQEVNLFSPGFNWVVRNTGDVPTGTLSVMNTNSTDFIVSNGCPATIAGGGMCTVNVVFRPMTGGPKSGRITVSATPGGSVSLNVDGRGQWRLTVNANVANTFGTVGTTDSVITGCGSPGCSALYDHNISVTVRATNVPLSGRHFATFSTPTNCSSYGNGRDCTVLMDAPRTVSATFLQNLQNLAFVSSSLSAATLGSPTQYDAVCNTLATNAGLNNANNDAFIAWLSSDTLPVTATTRLGTGKGTFRRIDNTLFATSETNLLLGRVLSPLILDEYGRIASAAPVFTGTLPNGTSNTGFNCGNWGSTTAQVEYGVSTGGPGRWTEAFLGGCSGTARLYCLQRTSTTEVSEPTVPPSGKIIFLAPETFNPSMMGAGLSSLDTFCTNNRPLAYQTRTFVAFAATTTTTAASRVTPTSFYYRPDGHFVGSGTDLGTGGLAISNGAWQFNNLTYANGLYPSVWTGANNATTVGTLATTCNNWATSGTTAIMALSNSLLNFFNVGSGFACNVPHSVYCIEP